MTKARLRRLATGFRRGILNGRSSGGWCYAISWPLQGYLESLGVKTELEMGDFGRINHYWLRLDAETILDATADQFSTPGNKLPAVYIGPVPPRYLEWILHAKTWSENMELNRTCVSLEYLVDRTLSVGQ